MDFSKIIAVRDRRLSKSQRKEAISRELCKHARSAVAGAGTEMNDYAAEIKSLEVRLITKLMDRRITIQDIHAVEAELKYAEQKAESLSKKYRKAERVLLEKEDQLTEIREERMENGRKVEKIKEIDKRIAESIAKSRDIADEVEMDEFAGILAARRLV